MITGRQIRAARALLDISQDDLASAAGLTKQGISKIEDGSVQPREGTLRDILRVFDERGIEFTDNQGLRMRPTGLTVYEGPDRFDDFFDFVFNHISTAGGEVCICGSSSKVFSKYRRRPENHRERMATLVKSRNDIVVRVLAEEGDGFMPANNYATYKWLPKEYFSPTTFYAFGEYFALVSFAHEPAPIVVCIHSSNMADDYRKSFNALWDRAAQPAPKENEI